MSLVKFKKVLIVGGAFPRELYGDEIASINYGQQLAANNFELSLADGVWANVDCVPYFISAPYFPSFLKGSKILYLKSRRIVSKKIIFCGISYLNIPIIKNIIKFIQLKKEIRRASINRDNDVVICSGLNLAQFLAVATSNFKSPCIKTVVIMDLPIFPGDCSFLYKFYLKYVEWPIVLKFLNRYDHFIVATQNISLKLKLKQDCVSVVDGIFNDITTDININNLYYSSYVDDNKLHKVLYSGSLDERYGIKKFIDEFHCDERSNCLLIICGSGPLSDYIKDIANKNPRVVYLGVIEVDKLRILQTRVDLLINPRDDIGDFNLYSFPSKTLEYMASGVVVLMNKLSCLSHEYNDLMYFREGNEKFVDAIYRVLDVPLQVRVNMGLAAKEFVLLSRTSQMQISRIFSEISVKHMG